MKGEWIPAFCLSLFAYPPSDSIKLYFFATSAPIPSSHLYPFGIHVSNYQKQPSFYQINKYGNKGNFGYPEVGILSFSPAINPPLSAPVWPPDIILVGIHVGPTVLNK